tara:strand:- start:44 stop:1078 length:1035 start_codon:yes stop_codon:yes gene_type:complete
MAAYTTIDNPELYFQTKLYTGDGTTSNAETFDGDEDMQPDMIWFKRRSGSANHFLYDSIRGANRSLVPNDTDAEATSGEQTTYLASFNSDGFTLGDDVNNINASNETYVAWAWKESADAGFDIITYSGTGSAKNESHSLSATPHWILTKCRSDAQSWATHHRSYSATEKVLYLNNTNALASTDPDWLTAVSSSTISLGGSGSDANVSGRTYVAYLWSEKQGFSKFGSFVANNQSGTDGTFVYLGFKARWFMWKNTTTGDSTFDHWNLIDTKRQTYNGNTADGYVQADAATAETSFSGNGLSVFANGVQISQGGRYHSESGSTYIYAAFAEAPFVNSNGVPCNAR